MTTITGNDSANLLIGTNSADVINAGGGSDVVLGGNGNDTINGGAGSDLISGGNGNDTIDGGSGNDLISGGNGNDTIDGGSGNDLISGDNGNDVVNGGSGNDLIYGDNGNDTLDGGSGNDLLLGGAGNDTLIYNAADNLTAFDVYDGGQGKDTLRLVVTQAIYASAAFQADVAALQAKIAHGSATYNFQSIDLYVTSIERLEVVIVGGGNQAPVAGNDNVTATEDTALTISAASLLANDSDPDGNPFTIVGFGNAQNGSVTFDGTNFVFTPADDFSGVASFTYTIRDSVGAESTATVTVNVAAVADAPTLTVADAAGGEDSAIALSIASSLTDGSESLSVTISGVPDGASLSAGTDNGGGVWTLTPAQLVGLTVTPAANSDDNFTLTVTATSTDGSDTETTVDTIQVTVNAAADAPSLTVVDATGDEDSAVALSIASSLTDTDGSESLSITISGVPTGASLSAGTDNGDGSWTLTVAQLAGLSITPPPNSDVDFTLTVTAASTETNGGDTETTVDTIQVTVNAVADAPIVTVGSASGTADASIPLEISVALGDVDESESIQSIEIQGIPDSYLLNAGTALEDGGWLVTPADLAGLAMVPINAAGGAFGTFALQIAVTSIDGGDTATTSATTSATMSVTIDAPADALTGRAIEGYIAGATVFADSDGDGVLDDGEVFTTTAADGTFTLIGGTGPLVMFGGKDVSTGLDFMGLLKAPEGSTVVTPLTTLVAELSATLGVEGAKTAVATAFGIDPGIDLQTFDPVPQAVAGDPAATAVLSAAVQVYSTIAQVSAVGGSGDAAIAAIADVIANTAGAINLGSTTTIETIATGSGVSPTAVTAVSEVVAAANTSIQEAANVTEIAQAAVVAQGETSVALATTDFNNPTAVSDLTTAYVTNLDDAVTNADVGDVDGPLVGTIGNDTLNGDLGVDAIEGLDGDDIINGSGGNDLLYGGAGKDRITGGEGNDFIDGGAGFDRSIYKDASAPIAVMLAAGTVTGGDGNDTLVSVESIRGTDFADTFDATGFTAVATGTAPNAGGDQGTFNEFDGGGGNDVVTGNGNTRISFVNATGAVSVNLALGTATGDASVDTDTITGGVMHVRGSAHGDTIVGSFNATGAETFEGWGGDDFIDGNGGLDRVRYDNQNTGALGIAVDLGAGTVTGRDAAATTVVGTDTLRSVESVRGSNAADIFDASTFTPNSVNGGGDQGNFNEFEGMGGNDVITGNGNTRISYTNATAGVSVNLALGLASGDGSVGSDTITGGVNAVRGSQFNDQLTGSNNPANTTEQFEGWGGNDTIDGAGGFDRVRYDNNNTSVSGVQLSLGISVDMAAGTVTGRDSIATAIYGADQLTNIESVRGTNADDIYVASGFNGASADATPFGTTFNEFEGMGGNDVITGNGNTRISFVGAAGGVTVDVAAGTATGDASVGSDTFTGVSRVRGSNFDDTISGDANNNRLEGQGGNDRLDGRGGNDSLVGGGNADTFVYGDGYGADTIDDFARGQGDKIDLTGVSGVYGFADLVTMITGTMIDFGGGNTLQVNGVGSLLASDFIFAENLPPSVALANAVTSLPEDTTAPVKVADIVVSDDGLGVNNLSLFGPDAASFEIVGTELWLKAGVTLDYESLSPLQVTVQVDDPGVGASPDSSADLALAITDVNEAPTAVSLNNTVTAIDENVAVGGGIKVADIAVTDDALGTETLTLTGADADKFAIVGSELRYIGPSPDFETQSSYSVTVNVNDESLGAPGSIEVSENFSLTINDVNEAPTAVSLDNAVAAIDENVTVGAGIKVADIAVTDDALGTETLTLTGADADKFTIVGGELHYIGPSPDFETQSSYSVTVNVDDEALGAPGSIEVSEDFTLTINDVAGVVLTGDAGDNVLDGTPEIDTLDHSATTMGVTVDLGAATASGSEIGNDTVTGFENVIGGAGDDTLRGHPGNNQLYGGDGNDFLAGGLGGTDLFDGGNGLDRVSFYTSVNSVNVDLAAGAALIGGFDKTLASVEFIRGTDQNDTYDATGFSGTSTNAGSNGALNEFEGMGGDDTVTGNGSTRVSYVNAAAAVTVTLTGGGAGTAFGTAPSDVAAIGTDTFLSGVTAVRGSDFNDTLTGSDNPANSNEQFEGWGGDDWIDGGGGFDRARYDVTPDGAALTGGITVNMAAGSVTGDASITAAFGVDTLRSVEGVRGTALADTYIATGFTDTSANAGSAGINGSGFAFNEFEGMGGDDLITGNGNTRVGYQNALSGVTVTLTGGGGGSATSTAPGDAAGIGTDTFASGVNRVRGSDFDDIITGNGGANVLEGLGGADFLTGNAGNDTFIFSDVSESPGGGVSDTITDFAVGADKIDLTRIDADLATGVDDAFVFVANATPETNPGVQANSITWFQDAGNTIVQADVNGDAVADMTITLTGLKTLSSTDFLL